MERVGAESDDGDDDDGDDVEEGQTASPTGTHTSGEVKLSDRSSPSKRAAAIDDEKGEQLLASARDAEADALAVAERMQQDADEELLGRRRQRAEKLHQDVQQLQKDIDDEEARAGGRQSTAKRRRLADLHLRAEDADAAVVATISAAGIGADADGGGAGGDTAESRADMLIRTGQITPLEAAKQHKEEPNRSPQSIPHPRNAESGRRPRHSGGDDDVDFGDGLRLPCRMHDALFEYQRTGVQWLWELHQQEVGGIVGDEMGLGKTIQVTAFLAALHNSGLLPSAALVVVPTTVLRQWQREIASWYPAFRVRILHQSERAAVPPLASVRKHIRASFHSHDVVLTSYELLRRNADDFVRLSWEYVVLDEGHRIRNPDAEVTLACKRFRTPHRLVMTGSPLQNRLRELWSLFDFIIPGKLGTLPVFEREFSVPIGLGGYATASAAQIHTAYHCATVLKDLVTPYILRRMKRDVAVHLPGKTEQVLFCRLTEAQRELYSAYLSSRDVRAVIAGRRNLLAAVTVLRKICNHPDLLEQQRNDAGYASDAGDADDPGEAGDGDDPSTPPPAKADFGHWSRSGKLGVLRRVLRSWYDESSRVLLFAQTRTLLDLLESFVAAEGYTYLRMDGLTSVSRRMALIDEYNTDRGVFVFLLTTKVGGFGVNLTGANRVVLFEPDWNPSNDVQARERAWRIGQTRDVTVYRLITSGTIEEKIYHRQIFKQFLSAKVLQDPKQRRFFRANDLKDLFTLGDDVRSTETGVIFAGTAAREERTVRRRARRSGSARAERGGDSSPHDDDERSGGGGGGGGDDPPERGETTLLRRLFEDGNALQSTIDHDGIVQAGEVTVDLDMIRHEASKVARQAAEQLRLSRHQRLQDDISLPTWTGRSGAAGREGGGDIAASASTATAPRTFGGGGAGRSSQLLARMRERSGDAVERSEADGRPGDGAASPTELIGQLVEFLEQRGGRASSADIVARFRPHVRGEQLLTFKSMLQQVARQTNIEGGESRAAGAATWTLRPDLQQ